MSLAVLCPGQGGQHSGMFDMLKEHSEADSLLAAAREVLPTGPIELAASGADIYQNRLAQPLVCAAILARWSVLHAHLPQPGVVLGYSVGELAAHAIAGSLTPSNCLRLAARRAVLMDEASPAGGGLVAVVGLNERQIESLCAAHALSIAIVNGAAHFVLGGEAASLDAAEREASALGAKAIRLKVGAPAHTHWLEPAAAAFARELEKANLSDPQLRILAGVDGHVVRSAGDAVRALSVQIARTINWRQCLTQAVEMGAKVFLELGPGSALTRIVREALPNCAVRSLDEFKSLTGGLAWVQRAMDEN